MEVRPQICHRHFDEDWKGYPLQVHHRHLLSPLRSPFAMNSSNIEACSFDGNPDLYGLGVRLGVYFQWFGQLFATIFNRDEELFQSTVNLFLQLAILTALMVTTTHGKLTIVDPFITPWLFFGALSSVTGDGTNRIGSKMELLRFALYSAISGYYCWFWFRGLWEMPDIHTPGCTLTIFFGGISYQGGFSTFGKAASIVRLAVSASMILLSLYSARSGFRQAESMEPKVELSLVFLSLMIIAVSIALVEYLVTVNDINGVHEVSSVGQSIALLAGIFTLWESIRLIIGEVMTRTLLRRREYHIFGRQPWVGKMAVDGAVIAQDEEGRPARDASNRSKKS